MKRAFIAIFVACVIIVVAFIYIHHKSAERASASLDFKVSTAQKINSAVEHKSDPELIQQLPGGSSTIVFADLANLRASSFARELASLAPTPAQDPEYTEFVRSTGFDYTQDLDRVAIALWPQTSSTSVLALAQGRFHETKIERYALHNGGRRLRIHGKSVYEFREQNSPRLVRFTFINSQEIALADGPALSQVLGPPLARLNPQMSARAAALSQDSLYGLALTQNLPGEIGLDPKKSPQLARLLGSIHAITAAGRAAGRNLDVFASAECDSALDAFELSTTLKGFLWMGRAALADPKTQQEIGPQWPAADALLKAADISHDGHFVRLRVQVTPQMLQAAIAAPGSGNRQ